MKKIHLQHIHGCHLRTKNRSLIQWATLLVAFWSVLYVLYSTLPGMFGYLKYLPDGILLTILLLSLCRNKIKLNRSLLVPFGLAVGFFFYTVFIYLFRYQSLAYFLWGFRNNFRFYIAFFAFITFLDSEDVGNWFRVMDVLFWIHVGVSTIQFLVFGISGDHLGGIFGILDGVNAYSICLMSIVVARAILKTLNGKANFFGSMLICTGSILVAAMAELKAYFVIMILLLMGAAVLTRFSFKKLLIVLLVVAVVMYGASLLVEWFGFEGFLSFDRILDSATRENYSGTNDINRLSAISILAQKLKLDPATQLFGLGLGNCDTSSFEVCNTPFFRQYEYLHYNWFSSAMQFLETGYLGVIISLGFLVNCGLFALKCHRRKIGDLLYNQLAVLMSILCCVLFFYNSALRTEAAYMMFFTLSLPFIRRKQNAPTVSEKG